MANNICVSTLFIRTGLVGGAEYMVKNLVEGLISASARDDRLTVLSSNGTLDLKADQRVRVEGCPARVNRFVDEWAALRKSAGQFDAILLPNYFTPPVRRSGTRMVTVIHDLQYLHIPENFSRKKRLWLRAAHEATLRLADTVVVISNFVKGDLLAHYGRRWDTRVRVIPNPISWNRFRTPPSDPHPYPTKGDRYILSVSAHYAHKNLSTLIRAFAAITQNRRYDDVRLVLAGQLGRNLIGVTKKADLEVLIEEMGLTERVIVTGNVSDQELGVLYRGATVFVFPSLFEGFGMPPIEALGFGLPVITTRQPAVFENTLGLAHYVEDPRDPAELASMLSEILDTPERFRPAEKTSAIVRLRYDPAAIGKRYYRVLTGHTPVPSRERRRVSADAI